MTEPAPVPPAARIGVVEWFRPGEHARVEQAIAGIRRLGITDLRTGVSWAEYWQPHGEAWYDWLLPRLAREFRLLPCLHYTPPSEGVVPKCAAPPRDPKRFADFLDVVITRHGRHFEWLELWNEPNNLNDWDHRLDPDWIQFCTMVGGAAYWAKQRGKRTVLAGTCPSDPHWLDLMGRRGVLDHIDAVSLHGFPGTWDYDWPGWVDLVTRHRSVLDRHRPEAEIWITETGYSTWRHDHRGQIRAFLDAVAAPVTRVYWYAYQDLAPEIPSQEGFHVDERHYHMGLVRADGTPKLLARLLAQGGLPAVRGVDRMVARADGERGTSPRRGAGRPVVITGGAGFIGTNLALHLAAAGERVVIYDNLSRPGVEENLARLRAAHPHAVAVELADIRDPYVVREAVRDAASVYHFAAQVAVTTSLGDPDTDFTVNARGTLNLLEALRRHSTPPPLVFTSTNKVYGPLEDVRLIRFGERYLPVDPVLRRHGIDEHRPLAFASPYGCSKGTADQYVLDYARSFGLPATVFRMSCIYGPYQHGTEDQGWVAHFLIRALGGQTLTLYGDGRQVRDLLYVEDLVAALLLARRHIGALAGQAFNIGGGPDNATSLLELRERIGVLTGCWPKIAFAPWRPGDQRYYVSNTSRFQVAIGWRPQMPIAKGLSQLARWLIDHRLDTLDARLRRAA